MPFASHLALLLAPALSLCAQSAHASGFDIIATGVVVESNGGPGPLGVAMPGDSIQYRVSVEQQGTPVIPGSVMSYALIAGASEFSLNGVAYLLASGGGPAHMMNDYSFFGDEIQVATTAVSGADVELYFVYRAVSNVWTSTDLSDAIGSYTPTVGDLFGLSISGPGADFTVMLSSVQVGQSFTEDPYCGGTSGSCPCGNLGAATEGCANSTGSGAMLEVGGSPSLVAGDLQLNASGMRANTSALLFHANGPLGGGTGSLLGDGLLCISGGVQRYAVRNSNGAGAVEWTAQDLLVGPWALGAERHFQVWYRDAPGGLGGLSPCGLGFNFSQAVRVRLQP